MELKGQRPPSWHCLNMNGLQGLFLPGVCFAGQIHSNQNDFARHSNLSVGRILGGIRSKTVALMLSTLLHFWPQRGVIHGGILTKNTMWGKMNPRGTGKECGIKTKGLSVPLTAFPLVTASQWLPDSCGRLPELHCVAVPCVDGVCAILCVKWVLGCAHWRLYVCCGIWRFCKFGFHVLYLEKKLWRDVNYRGL